MAGTLHGSSQGCGSIAMPKQKASAAHLGLVVQLWQRQVGAAGCKRGGIGLIHEQRSGGCAVKGYRRHAGAGGAPKLRQQGK